MKITSPWLAVGLLALISSWQTANANANIKNNAKSNGQTAMVQVNITTTATAKGRIGCALFNEKNGFPMDLSDALQMWQKPVNGKASCVFNNLNEGVYAIAVFQDLNNNGVVDRNFFGIPQEPWAVSNNVRHRFREPSFSESQFKVVTEQPTTINLTIKK